MSFGVPENKECIYDYYENEFFLQINKEGFVDRRENMKKTRRLAIRLAMCMSAADGYIDQSELDSIDNWVNKISSMEDEEDRQAFVDEFSGLIFEANQQAVAGELSLEDTILSINKYAIDEDKFEAVELILDVMTADGKADQSELNMLDSVTTKLQLDPSQVRALRDKRISSADSVQLDKADLKSLVGIGENMSPEEIRRHLNTEFRKWNSRATSGDEAGRKRASEMLDNIAEARRQYLS
jgi:tellurite resistance protein